VLENKRRFSLLARAGKRQPLARAVAKNQSVTVAVALRRDALCGLWQPPEHYGAHHISGYPRIAAAAPLFAEPMSRGLPWGHLSRPGTFGSH
jgi:hypothetical protein